MPLRFLDGLICLLIGAWSACSAYRLRRNPIVWALVGVVVAAFVYLTAGLVLSFILGPLKSPPPRVRWPFWIAFGILVRWAWIRLSVRCIAEFLDRPAFDLGGSFRQRSSDDSTALEASQSRAQTFEKIVNELCELGKAEGEDGNSPYLTCGVEGPKGWELRARVLGRELRRLGGKSLISQATDRIRSEIGEEAARNLTLAWQGIGMDQPVTPGASAQGETKSG